MPAFTFEKLSAPANREPATPPEKQPRRTLVQLLNGLVHGRAKRRLRRDHSAHSPPSKTAE
jgi:hypothetical protein